MFRCSLRYQIKQPAALSRCRSMAEKIGNILCLPVTVFYPFFTMRGLIEEKMKNTDSCFAKVLEVHIHLETIQSQATGHIVWPNHLHLQIVRPPLFFVCFV